MNCTTMKQLIENANTREVRDAYIEAFEAMTGWSYETLYMTDEEFAANARMYRIQQEEHEPIEFVETFTSLQ